jgi:hypothetical protein
MQPIVKQEDSAGGAQEAGDSGLLQQHQVAVASATGQGPRGVKLRKREYEEGLGAGALEVNSSLLEDADLEAKDSFRAVHNTAMPNKQMQPIVKQEDSAGGAQEAGDSGLLQQHQVAVASATGRAQRREASQARI